MPNTIIADNTGGILMQRGDVDMCIVGTDRTLSTGDVANKIGTYLKGISCYMITMFLFMLHLPSSTIDWEHQKILKIFQLKRRNSEELSSCRRIR